MAGPAPQLPSSGWKVIYEAAVKAFIADPANLPYGGAVSDWVVRVRAEGPPEVRIDAGEDYYLSEVPGTTLTVEYLIIEAEFLVIVKQFMRS